jgi:hypothetical protein
MPHAQPLNELRDRNCKRRVLTAGAPNASTQAKDAAGSPQPRRIKNLERRELNMCSSPAPFSTEINLPHATPAPKPKESSAKVPGLPITAQFFPGSKDGRLRLRWAKCQ